ncbi:MAG: response regulator [Planctomycetes bacterium]|nr:response regulator [Planctomycetota bacterium]
MPEAGQAVHILMAEDDPDDRLMAEQALRQYRLKNGIRFVEDGQELMDYLRRQGKYATVDQFPLPDVILLDRNMPRKDGREALAEIKSDRKLRRIPVIVLTTSKAAEDILRSYDLGVNAYITKPVTFQGLAEAMRIRAKSSNSLQLGCAGQRFCEKICI